MLDPLLTIRSHVCSGSRSAEAEVEWHVSDERATRAVRSALPHVNAALDMLRRLFLLESLSDALKVPPACDRSLSPRGRRCED